jgi:hypothetical protein
MAEGYPSAAQIVRELGDQGVVCLQSFFDASSVACMRKEATALLDARPVLRVEPATLDHRFPSLAQAFNSDLFREIAVGYDPKCKFLCESGGASDNDPFATLGDDRLEHGLEQGARGHFADCIPQSLRTSRRRLPCSVEADGQTAKLFVLALNEVDALRPECLGCDADQYCASVRKRRSAGRRRRDQAWSGAASVSRLAEYRL